MKIVLLGSQDFTLKFRLKNSLAARPFFKKNILVRFLKILANYLVLSQKLLDYGKSEAHFGFNNFGLDEP